MYIWYVCVRSSGTGGYEGQKELQEKEKKQGSLRSFASIRAMQCTVLWCGFRRSELITMMNFLFSSGSVEY